MNLDSHEYEETKGLAEDLSEGKFSFPIIHGIYEQPQSTLLSDVLNERPKTPTLKLEAIDYLRHKTRSFEYSRLVLNTFEEEIRGEIEQLGGNEHLTVLVDLLANKMKAGA
ncbi:hypothetical protein VKT23_008169 [Stygiomarasmius scandens]|uniref:Uncharacterized protein n=1 Tax=Marasmiellus scandens TaxID=2682957 RepID=A0ABR1JJQ2_9AGAR